MALSRMTAKPRQNQAKSNGWRGERQGGIERFRKNKRRDFVLSGCMKLIITLNFTT